MISMYAIVVYMRGEEGESTHRQSTQPVKIFTMGKFTLLACRDY